MSQLTVAMAVEAVNDVLQSKRRGRTRAVASTPLAGLGLDSLEVAELFAALEDRCGLELDPESGRSLVTVADLTQLSALGPRASVTGEAP
jgi:acyl carrier protein